MGNQNWCMIVDELSKVKFSSFHKTKDGIIDTTCASLSKWRAMGLPTENLRCDNAGENKMLEKEVNGEKWKLNLNFEHTARATLQLFFW